MNPSVDRPRKEDRYLYVARPRCPECASPKLKAYRSMDNGDGSISRYVRCEQCGRKLILVLE
jgi:transposase-like protein